MPALGTEAVFPVDKAHTAAGAVMVQLGLALTMTLVVALPVQPFASVTVRV